MGVCPRGFEPHPYYHFWCCLLGFYLQFLPAKGAKDLSYVGFEPTPTFVDQNALSRCEREGYNLESGALDHSAMLTDNTFTSYLITI